MSKRDKLMQIKFFDFYRAPKCFIFALAVNEGTGRKMVCIEQNGVIVHAGLRGDNGTYRDIRGEMNERVFVRDFVDELPYIIRDTTKEELMKVSESANGHPIEWELVIRAMGNAESVWPDWGWKNSFEKRVVAFTEELEDLCRKHGVYLREQVPAERPILYQMSGEESGFQLTPLPSAHPQYILERILK